MFTGSILIRFYHPTKDLNFLSTMLGLSCARSWTAGSPRQTPRGELLSGTYKDNYWYSRLEFPSESGFKKKLIFAIDLLVKERETLRELKASGGKIELYLQLSGSINNGGTIESEILRTMSDLGIDLLIEVFVGV